MKDINEFTFSGTVERFDRIQTKTGTPMVAFTVMCWRERIRTVAFKNIAEQITLNHGDRVECRGHIQSTSWTDKNGQQRSGWQVIAHEIRRADGDEIDRQQEMHQEEIFPEVRRPDTGSEFKYTEVPFLPPRPKSLNRPLLAALEADREHGKS